MSDPHASPTMPQLFMVSEALVWAHRACSEMAVSAHFAVLSRALRTRSPKTSFAPELEGAAIDAHRNARLCADHARTLGWHGEVAALPWTPVTAFTAGSGAQMLFELVAALCISEPMSGALLRLEVAAARDADAAQLAKALLRAKLQSATLGARFLARATSHANLGFLRGPLSAAVRSAFATEAARPMAAALALPQRVEQLRRGVQQVIHLGLESGGKPLQWLAA